jgi:hypothetical protein
MLHGRSAAAAASMPHVMRMTHDSSSITGDTHGHAASGDIIHTQQQHGTAVSFKYI